MHRSLSSALSTKPPVRRYARRGKGLLEERQPRLIVGGQRRWGSVVRDGDVFEEPLNLEGVGDEGIYEHGGAAVEAGERV